MKLLLTALMFVFWASCGVQAAIVEVNAPNERDGIQTSSGVDSENIVLTNGATTGDFIVVAGNAYDAPPSSITVTAGCVTSFTVLSSAPAGVTRQFIAYGFANATGACTVNIDPQGSAAYIGAGAVKFTGVNATPLDVDDGETHASGTQAVASITTVAANALIISTMMNGTQTTVTTPDASVTEIAEGDDNSCCTTYAVGYRIVTTPGSYDMVWDMADNVAWRMHTASFAPSVASSGQRRVVEFK